MKIIGLTGNIASGKSTVASILKNLGASIIDADQIARDVVGKGKPALQKIADHFGTEVLKSDETLNREVLGSIVFNDEDKREILNSIIHPEILREISTLIDKYRSEGKDIVIIEAALIVEREKLKQMIDKLIVVNTSEKTQMERLMRRNDYSAKQAQARINSQMPAEQKIKHADYIINNDSDLEHLSNQTKEIWDELQLDD
ncbi:MAG TPA: dephospho-CoA kinase [Thermodesulfobacteriota bacterium]|nr:dephospho-CoA kinase [Thermodesulfobacteriota bacterium]